MTFLNETISKWNNFFYRLLYRDILSFNSADWHFFICLVVTAVCLFFIKVLQHRTEWHSNVYVMPSRFILIYTVLNAEQAVFWDTPITVRLRANWFLQTFCGLSSRRWLDSSTRLFCVNRNTCPAIKKARVQGSCTVLPMSWQAAVGT